MAVAGDLGEDGLLRDAFIDDNVFDLYSFVSTSATITFTKDFGIFVKLEPIGTL